MTQPQRVIYLPPGLAPAPGPIASPARSGVPFDRAFFEEVLPKSIQSFCNQVECTLPVVELLTVDGTTHFVNAVSGVADEWVALQTSSEGHTRPIQVFLPYNTIFRVEIHPEPDTGKGHLGFVLSSAQQPPTVITSSDAPQKSRRPAATKKK